MHGCLFSQKGGVQANLRVSSPMRSNEPPSPKKTLLRDYEQPFSFNKGGLPGKSHCGWYPEILGEDLMP